MLKTSMSTKTHDECFARFTRLINDFTCPFTVNHNQNSVDEEVQTPAKFPPFPVF
jgi:hypothetical protein